MDLNAIDPRATSQAADSRKSKSSNGDAFQGVMQMMAKIDANRTENQARDRSASDRPSHADKTERDDRTVRAERKDKPTRKDEAAETDKQTTATETEPTVANDQAVPPVVPQLIQTADGPAGTAEQSVAPEAAAETVITQADSTSGQASSSSATPAPTNTTPKPETAVPAAAQPQPAAAQAPIKGEAKAEDLAALARQGLAQREQVEPTAKPVPSNGDVQKPDGSQKTDVPSGRADALMGAKVTVETPVPVARSQGVSSAVLVQAQQAAAGGQAQASNANGGAGTLHVGGNQPTFVGADGSASNANANAGQGGSNNAGGQNAGANNQAQNQGQGGQPNPQQVGISFGATIGQRGFGGDASRAQFQEILATRTARAQPASLAGGEAARSTGAATSSTPMAGVGGPQSTHTSASPVDRAAATAHGRPGAHLGTPADQVAMKMSATAKDGGGKVTIRLSPEELGKVDIKMEISKDGLVRAVVAVDRPETLELLQRDAKGLERVLQNAGLQTDGESLEFDLRGDGGQYAGDADDRPGSSGADSGGISSPSIEGDSVAADQQGDEGTGGMKADGSLDLVA